MLGFTTVAILHTALLATTGSEYQDAYNRAEKAGKPLLVLVGTGDNSEFRTMKEKILPDVLGKGELKKVVFVEVNPEAKPKLSKKIVRGDSRPQLVLYTPVGKLWRRTHLSGVQPKDEVRAFLERQIEKGREVARLASEGKPIESYTRSDVTFSFSSGGS